MSPCARSRWLRYRVSPRIHTFLWPAISSSGSAPQEQRRLLIPDSTTYLQSRVDDVQGIESHVLELGSTFDRLSVLLSGQEEAVERIEAVCVLVGPSPFEGCARQ